jgi:hypothetical protein
MFFLKYIKTTTYWIDPNQPRLTYQINDSGHKTMITPYKIN